jgi:hypothetical protein
MDVIVWWNFLLTMKPEIYMCEQNVMVENL